MTGRVAVVVGASGGIGHAIAVALSRERAKLCVLGRNAAALSDTAAAAREFSQVDEFQVDLTAAGHLEPLLRRLKGEGGRVDILIHCADVIRENPMTDARIEDFDLQYSTNIRGPYLLTQRLLPFLIAARGQIVFINSSVALNARRSELGQYSATKHALKAIADSLREEVNPKGIRVATVYLGRTATPRQQSLYEKRGKAYRPETLMQPEDVALAVVQLLMLPSTAEVTDISMRSMVRPAG